MIGPGIHSWERAELEAEPTLGEISARVLRSAERGLLTKEQARRRLNELRPRLNFGEYAQAIKQLEAA